LHYLVSLWPTPPKIRPNIRKWPPDCGFPTARIVILFSLAVGTMLEAAIGQYPGKQTGGPSLIRTLHNALRAGEIFLTDRCFQAGLNTLSFVVPNTTLGATSLQVQISGTVEVPEPASLRRRKA
jgi:hypothetical protein